LIFEKLNIRDVYRKATYLFLFLPDIVYLLVRFVSGSHWQGGDYSYDLIKLPFNTLGNIFGYTVLSIFGPIVMPVYEKARDLMKANIPVAIVLVVIALAIAYFAYKFINKSIRADERRIIYFGLTLFVIGLLPFLPLGNITSRYVYFASFGVAILVVYVLQKIYTWILENNTKAIASAALVVIVSSYILLQVIQVQQTFLDWRGAGQRAENFLVAIADSYSDYWSTTPLQFHFVNVPTKVGEAWVFPVGIEDALWFAFKNPNVTVTKETQVTPQLQEQISKTFKVFEFNDDGTVNEVQPPKEVSPTPTPTSILRSR
jgi:hypothetical protein